MPRPESGTTDWMDSKQLLTWLEENRVATPMTFGYEMVKLMRWVAAQKLVIQSPYSRTKVIIRSKVRDTQRRASYGASVIAQVQVTVTQTRLTPIEKRAEQDRKRAEA